MIEKIQQFLKGPFGAAVAIVVCLVGGVVAYLSVRNNVGPTEAGRLSRDRVFVCTETGKPFNYTVGLDTKIPVPSPHSGKNTGVPAEFCYWTKDGKLKKEPTPVALNIYTGKRDPTFCPDCGRLVVQFNPEPTPEMKPPPTKEEYKPRQRAGGEDEQ